MKRSYIELLGEKHPLCFSMSAVEEIAEEFGDVDAMSSVLTSGKQSDKIRAASKVLDILLRAGRRYCLAMGEDLPPALPCSVADILDPTDTAGIQAIFDTMRQDTAQEVEAKSKNASPTQGK